MSLVDLPEIEFVETDIAETVANLITTYEAVSGRTLYQADPVRLFLLSVAQIIVQQRVLINQVAKGSLLRYARGAMLDHLGAFAGTDRLSAAAATTTIRFTLAAPQQSAIAIPSGTRVSSAGNPKRYFSTNAYAEVTPGQMTVDVGAICTEVGDGGNGFLPGQIKNLVDLIPYVQNAENTTESAGGSDIETDDAYRERIRSAPEAFSVAGPEGAYRYWAKTASARIVDVSVSSPSPGEVQIVPLLEGGQVPGTELLDTVFEICNSRTIRPLTDSVSVVAPTAQNYNIGLTYWINREQSAGATAIQNAVTEAVAAFALWQKSKLGRAINPSELIRRVMEAGAYRVNVASPVYTDIDVSKVAIANTVSVIYGGLTDD